MAWTGTTPRPGSHFNLEYSRADTQALEAQLRAAGLDPGKILAQFDKMAVQAAQRAIGTGGGSQYSSFLRTGGRAASLSVAGLSTDRRADVNQAVVDTVLLDMVQRPDIAAKPAIQPLLEKRYTGRFGSPSARMTTQTIPADFSEREAEQIKRKVRDALGAGVRGYVDGRNIHTVQGAEYIDKNNKLRTVGSVVREAIQDTTDRRTAEDTEYMRITGETLTGGADERNEKLRYARKTAHATTKANAIAMSGTLADDRVAAEEGARQQMDDARDRYFTTGAGAGTIRGEDYRYRKRRRQEARDLRHSGRIGRALHRLGFSSKTAGRVGRVFGKIGAAALIVGAIVAMGTMLYRVLARIADTVVRIGNEVIGRNARAIATNLDTEQVALFNAFAEHTGRGENARPIDMMSYMQSFSNRAGNLVADRGAGLSQLLGQLAPAMANTGQMDRVIDLVLQRALRGGNIAEAGSAVLGTGLYSIINNIPDVTGAQMDAQRLAGYLTNAGLEADADFIANWLAHLDTSPGGRERASEEIRAAMRGEQTFFAAIENMIGEIDRASLTRVAMLRPDDEDALAQIGRAARTIRTEFDALIESLRRGIVIHFADGLLRAIDNMHRTLTNLAIGLSRLPGVNIPGLEAAIHQINENTHNEARAQVAAARSDVAHAEQVALAAFTELQNSAIGGFFMDIRPEYRHMSVEEAMANPQRFMRPRSPAALEAQMRGWEHTFYRDGVLSPVPGVGEAIHNMLLSDDASIREQGERIRQLLMTAYINIGAARNTETRIDAMRSSAAYNRDFPLDGTVRHPGVISFARERSLVEGMQHVPIRNYFAAMQRLQNTRTAADRDAHNVTAVRYGGQRAYIPQEAWDAQTATMAQRYRDRYVPEGSMYRALLVAGGVYAGQRHDAREIVLGVGGAASREYLPAAAGSAADDMGWFHRFFSTQQAPQTDVSVNVYHERGTTETVRVEEDERTERINPSTYGDAPSNPNILQRTGRALQQGAENFWNVFGRNR